MILQTSQAAKAPLLNKALGVATAAGGGSLLRFLVAVLVFLVGLELGQRLAKRRAVAPAEQMTTLQRLSSFWLAGSDGRVNYSRATAAAGLLGFLTAIGVALTVFAKTKPPMIELLYAILMACLGMLGINLGQFGSTALKEVALAKVAKPAPPDTVINMPPAAPTSSVTVNTAPDPRAQRRDSGVGATQLIPATPPPFPPDNPPPG